MTEVARMFLLILHFLLPRGDAVDKARTLAPIVVAESARFDLDPEIVVAVLFRESSIRFHRIGAANEIGLGQLKRGKGGPLTGFQRLPDRALMAPRLNIRLTAQYLARARDKCGGGPRRWLSWYNGRGCGASRYSRAVLRGLSRAQNRREANRAARGATFATVAGVAVDPVPENAANAFDPVRKKTAGEGPPAPTVHPGRVAGQDATP